MKKILQKKLVYCLMMAVIILPGVGQALANEWPFSYNGYARDCGCTLMASRTGLTIHVSIIEDNPAGTIVYKETHTGINNAGISTNFIGLYHLEVGSIAPDPGYNISDVHWTDHAYFIKVKINDNEEVVQRLSWVTHNVTVDANPTCTGSDAGVVRYTSEGEIMEFWNGREWVTICCGTNCPNACGTMTSVTDDDSRVYPVVGIGKQCWMAANLNKGTRIDVGTALSFNSTIEKYCYNDIEANCYNYGGLYTWSEMMQINGYDDVPGITQGICPDGFHIPTDGEWKILELFLGMDNTEVNNTGNRGNIQGIYLWLGGATGFNAHYSKYYDTYSPPAVAHVGTRFWTASFVPVYYKAPCFREIFQSGQILRDFISEQYLHVRCLKD